MAAPAGGGHSGGVKDLLEALEPAAAMPTVIGEMMPARCGYFCRSPWVTWVAVVGPSFPYTIETRCMFGYFVSSCFM